MGHLQDRAVVITGLICITVVLLATFIWPTPYSYDRMNHCILKITRCTGSVEGIGPNEWR